MIENRNESALQCPIDDFQYLFNPQSLAIIGASKNKIGGSKYYLANKGSGFLENPSQIYLINPKLETLFGEQVYPNIKDERIPKPIDLAIIAVPAEIVPQVILECDQIVRYAVIYTSGFIEAGNKKLQRKLEDAIAQVSTRFVGPNGLGIINPYHNLTIYPGWVNYCGNISYIAQSGGTLARLYLMLGTQGIGFRKAVSIGNAADIKITELMQCFASDPKTELIALYLESIPNGREFYQLAKDISKTKPIILWKGGQTPRGIKATFSHTGGLAGDFEIWKAVAKQTGLFLVNHFELFMDTVQTLAIQQKFPQSKRICVLVAGGGLGVEFTDLFVSNGLEVPPLSPETVKKLGKIFPAVNTNFTNPIDMGEWGYNPLLFEKAFYAVLDDPNIDSVVFVREPERFAIISQLLGIPDAKAVTVESLKRIQAYSSKPIFCNLSKNKEGPDVYQTQLEFKKEVIELGIPVIDYIRNLPEIITQLYQHGHFLENMW